MEHSSCASATEGICTNAPNRDAIRRIIEFQNADHAGAHSGGIKLPDSAPRPRVRAALMGRL